MNLRSLSPGEARSLLTRGACLIDIRDADEYARARIDGARNVPLAKLAHLDAGQATAVIYHCRSGQRTAIHATRLATAAGRDAYLLEGGIDGWRKAGLPVIENPRAPLELMRQVQIVAGTLILMGVVLSLWVAPAFLALSAFVGAGLLFAGVTGWCGMARLLATLPWNRRTLDP